MQKLAGKICNTNNGGGHFLYTQWRTMRKPMVQSLLENKYGSQCLFGVDLGKNGLTAECKTKIITCEQKREPESRFYFLNCSLSKSFPTVSVSRTFFFISYHLNKGKTLHREKEMKKIDF